MPKPQKHDFSLELTRVIEPKGGPGVELATLEDAAHFMGKMRSFRQRWPHWDYAAELVLIAATTGEQADIERATARMERAQSVVTMPHGSYSFGETPAKQKMVRLVCDKCGRRGQYRIDRLLEQYGPDVAMPDLRHELAQCPHRRDMSNPCQVRYVD